MLYLFSERMKPVEIEFLPNRTFKIKRSYYLALIFFLGIFLGFVFNFMFLDHQRWLGFGALYGILFVFTDLTLWEVD